MKNLTTVLFAVISVAVFFLAMGITPNMVEYIEKATKVFVLLCSLLGVRALIHYIAKGEIE